MHGIARLRFERTPVGRDGRDDDAVAALEVAHERADLNDLTHGLVTEDHVVAVADGALPHGMDAVSYTHLDVYKRQLQEAPFKLTPTAVL